MRIRILLLTFAISASLAFGQLDSNSVTVTASRSASLQPDQAVFGVFVTSGPSTSLDEILAAVKGAGITIGNFSGVSSLLLVPTVSPLPSGSLPPTFQPPALQWSFGLPVPLANIAATVKSLTTLQQSIPQQNSGLALSFNVQGTQVSQQLRQSQTCVLTDLISDAQTQAQKLAVAAGLGVGNILAMSSPTTTAVGSAIPPISGPGFTSLLTSSLLPPVCAVTVKFALGRF